MIYAFVTICIQRKCSFIIFNRNLSSIYINLFNIILSEVIHRYLNIRYFNFIIVPSMCCTQFL